MPNNTTNAIGFIVNDNTNQNEIRMSTDLNQLNTNQIMGSSNIINNQNFILKEEIDYKDSKIVTLIITGMREKSCDTGL